ncbi:MAG: hypothetical protein HHJ12_08540 [Glaciimonas sp.]|nr:hypothetical protein [Glaciimonas sp.]
MMPGNLPSLLRLGGDQGARRLLAVYPVMEIEVDDAGIGRDIDTAIVLEPLRQSPACRRRSQAVSQI